MRILVVEDEPTLAAQLTEGITSVGYVVDAAHNGVDGHFLGDTEPYDAVVLDIGLPQMDGITVLKKWRAAGRTMPVLILTARDTWREKVAGIDAGADDYLTKPFDMTELMARVEALIRRARWRPGHMAFTVGRLRVDPVARQATRDGEPVELTELELKLLVYLMERQGEAVSRADLLRDVWAMADTVQTRSVDVFMSRLRKLIEDDATEPRWLQSVRGVGYRLAP